MADIVKDVQTEENVNDLIRVRREKLKALQDAGRDPFAIRRYDVSHRSGEIKAHFDELEEKEVTIAGRLMSKRIMGKASFAHIQDFDGLIQVYTSRDTLGEEAYAEFKKDDVGDIVGVKGEVFRTKTGEISVRASEFVLLSKSLQPLPEKFHGLTNVDQRYRQRYVDLITNPESKDV
ncbi:MAG: lysine--tRNA ligase, partial [Clostridia bacterium]|nr:lysine--tRNA ligase [Clostridia bacterium]